MPCTPNIATTIPSLCQIGGEPRMNFKQSRSVLGFRIGGRFSEICLPDPFEGNIGQPSVWG